MKWSQIKSSEHVPRTRQSSFLRRLSDLLARGLTLPQSIEILLPHYVDSSEQVEQRLVERFRNGDTISEVLLDLGFSSRYVLAVTYVSTREQLITGLKEASRQIEQQTKYEKEFKKIITYPFILFLFLLLFLAMFEQFFIPNVEQLYTTRLAEQKGMAYWLPFIVTSAPKVIILLLLLMIGSISFFYVKYQRVTPAERWGYLMRIPIVKRFVQYHYTYHFASFLSRFLQSGLPVQQGIEQLRTQKHEPMLQEVAMTIEQQMSTGLTLDQVVERLPYFPKPFVLTVRHGIERNQLGEELMIYAQIVEGKLVEKGEQIIRTIQPVAFGFIATFIVLLYLAMMLPIYQMVEYVT